MSFPSRPCIRHGVRRVYNSEEAAMAAILDGTIVKGDVIVIRYEGPRGGPGMREIRLRLTSAWHVRPKSFRVFGVFRG